MEGGKAGQVQQRVQKVQKGDREDHTVVKGGAEAGSLPEEDGVQERSVLRPKRQKR